MPFKSSPLPTAQPDPSLVAARFAGLGANLAMEPAPNGPIEETLVAVSVLGMEEDDLRLLSLLTDWLDHHRSYLYADRLFRCVAREPSVRVHAFWAAIGQQDRRLKRLTTLYTGPRLDLLHAATELQVARRGEDPRFAGTPLRVPAGTLRKRESDLLSASALVAHHAGFRNRVQMGPSCRADLWTLLEAEPTLTPAEAARRAGCSFASAWQAVQDFALWRAGQAAR